jgi:hypothetical protein
MADIETLPPQAPTPESGAMDGGSSGAIQEQAPQAEKRPETYLEQLERHGAQVTPAAPQPVHDNYGQQITQPAPANVTTVTIPKNQVELVELAKGPDDKAITWIARYWIRLIKKAVHFGWRLVIPPSPEPVKSSQIQPVQPVLPNQSQPTQQIPPLQNSV